jgi:serine/threonine protein phosphatase PrpC
MESDGDAAMTPASGSPVGRGGDDAAQPAEPAEEGNGRLARHAVLAKLSWALVSEPGEVRPHNEDYAGTYAPTIPDDAWDRGPLFVVADGMGGHAAGEVASRLAVETMLASWTVDSPGAPAASIRAGARAANTAVCDAGMESGHRGMGTTLTALTLAGKEAVIAHVGDSRAYLVRAGETTQLTTDHSRVADLLRMRMITAEQAINHPARSMLTRSLGAEMLVQVDLIKQPIGQGDVFVLCSDGMWDMVGRADIAEIAGAIGTPAFPTPAEAARTLVDTAIKRGAPDNVTAVVVRITSDRPIPAAGARRLFFRRGKA